MASEDMLWGLLVASTVLALHLAAISLLAFGRATGDLDRLAHRPGQDGSRIQAWMNLLLYANLAGVGVVFGAINILLLAGAPESWRMWLNRGLWTFLLLSLNGLVIMLVRAERAQVRLSRQANAIARDILEAAAVESVDVATIQPAAVEDIAAAVRPEVAKEIIAAVTEALPPKDAAR